MPLEKGHGDKRSQRANRGCLRLGPHQAVSLLPGCEKGLPCAGRASLHGRRAFCPDQLSCSLTSVWSYFDLSDCVTSWKGLMRRSQRFLETQKQEVCQHLPPLWTLS